MKKHQVLNSVAIFYMLCTFAFLTMADKLGFAVLACIGLLGAGVYNNLADEAKARYYAKLEEDIEEEDIEFENILRKSILQTERKRLKEKFGDIDRIHDNILYEGTGHD